MYIGEGVVEYLSLFLSHESDNLSPRYGCEMLLQLQVFEAYIWPVFVR